MGDDDVPLHIGCLFLVRFFPVLPRQKSLSTFGSWIRLLEPGYPLPVVVEPSHGRFPEDCPECVVYIQDSERPLPVAVVCTAESHPWLPVMGGESPSFFHDHRIWLTLVAFSLACSPQPYTSACGSPDTPSLPMPRCCFACSAPSLEPSASTHLHVGNVCSSTCRTRFKRHLHYEAFLISPQR